MAKEEARRHETEGETKEIQSGKTQLNMAGFEDKGGS